MTDDDRAAYSAPALEKGLDILELLAAEPEPMTARQIGERLGRSKSEIFRMVYVLVERGYLLRDPSTDRLSLSNHLFELGMRSPRARTLVEVAMPEMEKLAEAVGHASHLVMVSHGQTVVIANAAPPSTPFNFFLQLGYGNAATEAVSGQTIIAFQTPERRAAMVRDARTLVEGGLLPEGLDTQLDAIRAAGSIVAQSRYIVGVIDVCAPILDRSGNALASIVVPCLQLVGHSHDFDHVRTSLIATCTTISDAIL